MLWTLFFPIVPLTCHSPAEFLWRTHVSLACGFIYFCYFLFPMRTLTFDRTPINDAHELHPRAETSCACQRCYFCKQFEGTASYGRIRVSCAHSLIRKVRVYRECVSVCACACVCTSKLSAMMRPGDLSSGNELAGTLLAVHTPRRDVFTLVVLSLSFCLGGK